MQPLFLNEIGRLSKYSDKRYPKPNLRWSKEAFELRSLEIHTCEDILKQCLDDPTKDPHDILEGYLLYLYWCGLHIGENASRKNKYKIRRNVVYSLLSVIKRKKGE